MVYFTTKREDYREYKSREYLCKTYPTRRMCTKNAKCEKTVLRHVWQDYVEMAEHVRYKPIVLRSDQAFRFVNESCIQKSRPVSPRVCFFVFAIGKSMDGLRRYRSGRFGFQTPTSAGLFADSYGFLFVGGLLAGWTFSPHLAAATE